MPRPNRPSQFLRLLLPLLIPLNIFFSPPTTEAYSPHHTHPDLTEEMAKLFNHTLSSSLNPSTTSLYPTLSQEDIDNLRQGSVDEDDPPRWINHFYDPIHHVGWQGNHDGNLSREKAYHQGRDMAPKEAIPSIDWAENQEYQSAYVLEFGNHTWQKAIHSYLKNDKKSAYLALGHILHLIEDASVPDHTRGDTHTHVDQDLGSPFEEYTKEFTDSHQLTVANDLAESHTPIPTFSNLREAFNTLALYSNQNFFSEDTIQSGEFEEPKLERLTLKIEENIGYLIRDNIFLLRISIDQTGVQKFSTNDKTFILPSYQSHLFPQVVLTGAGVINLFFHDVEKYRTHPEQLEALVPDQKISLSSLFTTSEFKRRVIKLCQDNDWPCNVWLNFAANTLNSLIAFFSQSTPTNALSEAVSSTSTTTRSLLTKSLTSTTPTVVSSTTEKSISPKKPVTQKELVEVTLLTTTTLFSTSSLLSLTTPSSTQPLPTMTTTTTPSSTTLTALTLTSPSTSTTSIPTTTPPTEQPPHYVLFKQPLLEPTPYPSDKGAIHEERNHLIEPVSTTEPFTMAFFGRGTPNEGSQQFKSLFPSGGIRLNQPDVVVTSSPTVQLTCQSDSTSTTCSFTQAMTPGTHYQFHATSPQGNELGTLTATAPATLFNHFTFELTDPSPWQPARCDIGQDVGNTFFWLEPTALTTTTVELILIDYPKVRYFMDFPAGTLGLVSPTRFEGWFEDVEGSFWCEVGE